MLNQMSASDFYYAPLFPHLLPRKVLLLTHQRYYSPSNSSDELSIIHRDMSCEISIKNIVNSFFRITSISFSFLG